MLRKFFAGFVIGSTFLFSGCATVAVFETVAETEVQLTKPQSQLHKASIAFCETSREAGWAEGESNFASLMRRWSGESNVGEQYWQNLTEFQPTPNEVVEQVAYDVSQLTERLNKVNELAQALLPSHGAATKPRNSDVVEFERVLIHAGQARETFAASFLRAKKAKGAEIVVDPATILLPLDEALSLSRSIVNGLASARMSDALASLDEVTS